MVLISRLSGIRRGDPMLPNDLLYRNAPHWNLGQCPFPHANTNFARYMKMAATEDQFVCVTPLPVLKGVSFSYKEFREARQCLQCDKETRVGVLFVHTNDETTRDIKNHWHCESCITESVLNLPPSSICITCLTVPKKLFCKYKLSNIFAVLILLFRFLSSSLPYHKEDRL